MIIGLKGDYNYKGIALKDAYARVDTTSSYDTNCSVSVNIYANEDAWENNEGYLEQVYPIQFVKKIGDTISDDRTQAYDYILTLDEFKGWTIVTDIT